MTLLDDRPPAPAPEPAARPTPPTPPVVAAPPAPSGSRLRWLLLIWALVLIVGQGLVLYGFGPTFQDRTQRSLLRSYRTEIDQAVHAGSGLADPNAVPTAPQPGQPVGIVEIGRLEVQQVVVEGVAPAQTRKGVGHVPGTAGLGQPGNAVVVGRRGAFGGVFSSLGSLRKGDKILVTTTQGQAVYKVGSVKRVSLVEPQLNAGSSKGTAGRGSTGAPSDEATIPSVYGPSNGDQLTLVTSASVLPWNKSRALVVTASLKDAPFAPTLQGARTDKDTGGQPDSTAKAAALLAVLVYGLAMGAAILLYKRLPTRVAYLLTVAPIVALTIITGETFSRLLPAWV